MKDFIDRLLIIWMILFCLVSVFCYFYTVIDLFRKWKKDNG